MFNLGCQLTGILNPHVTSGHIRKGVSRRVCDAVKLTLNTEEQVHELGSGPREHKGESQKDSSIHYSLIPGCGYNVAHYLGKSTFPTRMDYIPFN